MVEEGEACDDGAASSACDADCTQASCGDATVNFAAGELCDDGNDDAGDLCDACVALAFELDSGGWDGLWPDVTARGEEFLVAYKRGNVLDVVVRTFDAQGAATSADIVITTDETPGPVSVAASREGGALVAWQYIDSSYGGIRYRMLDDTLEPLPGVEQWTIGEGGRDPRVAAGQHGGYCIAGFLKSLPVKVNCVNAQGELEGGSSFPDTFGGMEYTGSHDIVAAGDGYVFAYVPNDETYDLTGYALTALGEPEGNPFLVTAFVDAHYSWVPKWGGIAGKPELVALAGLRQEIGMHELFYQRYSGPGQPVGALEPVPSTPDPSVREGLVLLHDSGRFAVVWLGDVELEAMTNYVVDCTVKARLFAADGSPISEDITLFDPAGPGCATGVRGAVNHTGDALLTWMFAVNGETMAVKQALLLPALLAAYSLDE